MLTGMEVVYQHLASLGDPDYNPFWNRVTEDPDNTDVGNIADGINKMGKERAILHVSKTMLKRHFLENQPKHRIKVFGVGRSMYKTVIVTINSPLKPIFTHGFKKVGISTICIQKDKPVLYTSPTII